MKQVIVATGLPDVDESILGAAGTDFIVTEVAASREELIEILNQRQLPEIVVISYLLPGDIDVLDILYSLRLTDVRVIFVAPTFNAADPTMKKILDIGIYDIVPGNTFGDIIEKIHKPNTFKMAVALFSGEVSSDINVKQIFQFNNDSKRAVRKDSDKPSNIIAVWSPETTGKTFVSVNLAAVLAEQGCSVALIDFDIMHLAIHTWLNAPPEEDALFAALTSFKEPETDIRNYFYRYTHLPSLNILTADPLGSKPTVKEKTVVQFLKLLSEEFDYVIVDTAGSFVDPFTKAVFKVCEKAMLITDLDHNHITSLHIRLNDVEKIFSLANFKLLINRFVDSPELSTKTVEIATGLPVAIYIPEAYQEVLESIKGGVPAVLLSPVLKKSFRDVLKVL